MGPQGLHPELSPQLEPIAREIFRLPHVEIASHSYSHPFYWHKVEQSEDGGEYHLKIPGYKFDLRREIAGSVDYINTRLAPPGKQVRVFLWSGDALPGKDALAMTRSMGLANLNGGNTMLTAQAPTLTQAYPSARPVDDLLQVYAPIANENVYTDLWRNPFYGYRQVIDTFRLTDTPRRLKPIAIYYHFYSGSKPASLKVLQEIYDWALGQETLPLWGSEYAAKVNDFDRLTLARRSDGGWQIRGLGALRTVRLDPPLGWPDLGRSQGVAALRDLPQGRYISFSGTLSQDEAAALTFAGTPEAATAFLRNHLARYPLQRAAWERLAGLQERSGEPRAAIEPWREISRRFGLTTKETLQLTALLWRIQRPGEALALLRDNQHKAGEKDTAFWQRMGELAWQQEADADALHAYRILWQTVPDALTAERLMNLERETQHTGEALTVATSAWQRFRQPRFLLFALDTANQGHRQDKLTELFKLADQAQDVFSSSENYWLLRARFAADRRQPEEVAAAWRQVLRLNPHSSQARAGLLWLFIDHDQSAELGRALAHWQNEAAKDEQTGQADAARRLRRHARGNDANGNIEPAEDTPPPRPRTVGFPVPVPGILGLEWRRHNLGALDIDRIDAVAMMSRKQWGAELQLGRRELSAPSRQLALTGRNHELDAAIAGKYRWQDTQTELRLGVNQRDDRNLPYARLTLDSIVRDDTSGRLSLSLNELSEESAALRAGGARDRIGMTLFSNLTRREYVSATLGWQRYHDRAGAMLGKGYGLDMELGHRPWLGTPEWRLRLQGSWVDNQLNSTLPAGMAAILAPGAGVNAVLPDRYATLGLGTTLQRGEPGSPLSPPLSPAYIFDAWAGGLWPAQRLAYNLRLGAAISVLGRDELSLNAFYANTQGGLPGQAWQGFALRYNRRLDW